MLPFAGGLGGEEGITAGEGEGIAAGKGVGGGVVVGFGAGADGGIGGAIGEGASGVSAVGGRGVEVGADTGGVFGVGAGATGVAGSGGGAPSLSLLVEGEGAGFSFTLGSEGFSVFAGFGMKGGRAIPPGFDCVETGLGDGDFVPGSLVGEGGVGPAVPPNPIGAGGEDFPAVGGADASVGGGSGPRGTISWAPVGVMFDGLDAGKGGAFVSGDGLVGEEGVLGLNIDAGSPGLFFPLVWLSADVPHSPFPSIGGTTGACSTGPTEALESGDSFFLFPRAVRRPAGEGRGEPSGFVVSCFVVLPSEPGSVEAFPNGGKAPLLLPPGESGGSTGSGGEGKGDRGDSGGSGCVGRFFFEEDSFSGSLLLSSVSFGFEDGVSFSSRGGAFVSATRGDSAGGFSCILSPITAPVRHRNVQVMAIPTLCSSFMRVLLCSDGLRNAKPLAA